MLKAYTNEADPRDTTIDNKCMIQTGAGFCTLEQERNNSGVKDLYLLKLDALIKKSFGQIRLLRKQRETINLEIVDFKAQIKDSRNEHDKLKMDKNEIEKLRDDERSKNKQMTGEVQQIEHQLK